MKKLRRDRAVILIQALGFGTIAALVWIDEVLHLPALLLGTEPLLSDWRESLLESCMVLLVATATLRHTIILQKKVNYLAGFSRMCAWCRKIGLGDKWISVEEYLKYEFARDTTHGICNSCERVLLADRALKKVTTGKHSYE